MSFSNSVLQEVKGVLDGIAGSPPHIEKCDMHRIAPLINRAGTLRIIEAVLSDEAALSIIAARSYTHTLGFRKVVLLDPGVELSDGTCGYGYQLRLHVWEPGQDSGVPLVESMHEHSFDFVSHLLLGEMENQCYQIGSTEADNPLVKQVLGCQSALPAESIAVVNRQIEAMEAMRLAAYGSQQFREGCGEVDRVSLAGLVGISEADLDAVVSLQGRYQSVASGTAGGGYVHRLEEMVKLIPHAVLRLRSGDTYYHPRQFAHRLYIRAGQANATMILTTPVSQNAKGGSFQRPTRVAEPEVNYARRIYSPGELHAMLVDFRERLMLTPAEDEFSSRFLSVE